MIKGSRSSSSDSVSQKYVPVSWKFLPISGNCFLVYQKCVPISEKYLIIFLWKPGNILENQETFLGNRKTFLGNQDTVRETGWPIELLIPFIIKVFINIGKPGYIFEKPGHNFEKLGYIFMKPRYISRRLASSDPYL